MDTLVAVIPLLGILIFVHELGHFLVAKACGVRVLKFSLGFGPPIGIGRARLRWERGGTEYVIAWFPLGGFVKMLGEQLDTVQGEEPEMPDAEPDEYLSAKPTWQKLAITLAGPAMNLLLPVVAFAGVLMIGLPRPAAVVGNVEPASPAAVAGVLVGDRILSINGEPTEFWENVDEIVRGSQGGSLRLQVRRDGEKHELSVAVERRSGLANFGAIEQVGWIGIGNHRLPALLGVPDPESPAAVAGLRSGDQVISVVLNEAAAAIENWEEFRRAYQRAAASGSRVEVQVLRAGEAGEEAPALTIALPALADLEALGAIPAAVLIDAVEPEAPAERAGLRGGDLVLAVDGQPIGSFASFVEIVRSSGGRDLELLVAGHGVTRVVTVTPELAQVPGPLGIEGMEEQAYRIGTRHTPAMLRGETTLDRELNPMLALPRAVTMTIEVTRGFLEGIGKLLTGDIGTDKLAGPIGIAQIARRSLDLGWQVYLSTMILISINLGFLNLLPIPILDGGQALIYAVEGIRRGPISVRAREIVQSMGLTILMALMGLAFWNDISRNWSHLVEWLSGGS